MDLLTTSLGFCEKIKKVPRDSHPKWRSRETNLCFRKILIINCR